MRTGKEWQIRVKRGKKIAVGILSTAVVVLLFAVLQRLVQPKYADDILEEFYGGILSGDDKA